jgi:hypothetical protein
MFGMFFLIFGIDRNIIDEHHYESVKLRHEYGFHEIHEVSGGIGEAKGHHQVLVETISGEESNFRNVIRSNFDW